MAPIKKAEAARHKGVSRAAVTAATKDGGALAAALVAGGKLVNPEHPAFRQWMGEEARGPTVAVRDLELSALNRQKRAAEVEKLELANAETRGALISRQLVKTHVYALIDGLFIRLLRDAAPSMARRVHDLASSGASVDECIQMARETISKNLKQVKDSACRTLGKHEKEETRGAKRRPPKRRRTRVAARPAGPRS